MIEGIDHVNLVVRDLGSMRMFYEEVLDFHVTKEAMISGEWIDEVVGLRDVVADVIYLDLASGPRIELIRYRQPKGTTPARLSWANTVGLRHIAFRVTEIDRVVNALDRAGVRTRELCRHCSASSSLVCGRGEKAISSILRTPKGICSSCVSTSRVVNG